jgi:hypothetical protein
MDLLRRCDKAVELMLETRSPLHRQVDQVLEVFNELTLDESQTKNEKIMFRHFAQVNEIFARYEIQSPRDYRSMSFRDLYSILFIVKSMIEKLDLPGSAKPNAE